jgi:hypothetical protein
MAWSVFKLWTEEAASGYGVVANILNKQSRAANKASPASLEVELETLHHKNRLIGKILKEPWNWTDSLDK